eukprot:g19606.t1
MRIYVIVLSQGHLLEFALSVCFATAAECRALAEAAGEEDKKALLRLRALAERTNLLGRGVVVSSVNDATLSPAELVFAFLEASANSRRHTYGRHHSASSMMSSAGRSFSRESSAEPLPLGSKGGSGNLVLDLKLNHDFIKADHTDDDAASALTYHSYCDALLGSEGPPGPWIHLPRNLEYFKELAVAEGGYVELEQFDSDGGRRGQAGIQPIEARGIPQGGNHKALLAEPSKLLLPPDKMPEQGIRSRVRASDAAWFNIVHAAHQRGVMRPVDDALVPRDRQGHLITNGAGGVEKGKQTIRVTFNSKCLRTHNRWQAHLLAQQRALLDMVTGKLKAVEKTLKADEEVQEEERELLRGFRKIVRREQGPDDVQAPVEVFVVEQHPKLRAEAEELCRILSYPCKRFSSFSQATQAVAEAGDGKGVTDLPTQIVLLGMAWMSRGHQLPPEWQQQGVSVVLITEAGDFHEVGRQLEASGEGEIREKLREKGICDYLLHPLSLEGLSAVISNAEERRLEEYLLLDILGRGATACVHKAKRLRDNETVALKEINMFGPLSKTTETR